MRAGGRAGSIGAYALAVACDAEPGTIVATRKDSPLVVGQGADGAYVASDMIALIDATRDVVVLGDGEVAEAHAGRHRATSTRPGTSVYDPKVTHVDWDVDVAEKGGYPDFMMKEIHEQPRVIRDTLAGRLVDGHLAIDELDLSAEELNLIDRVYVIACGTSLPCRPHCQEPGGGLGAHPRARWRWPASSATATPSSRRPRWWWPCRSRARRPTRWPPSATHA